MRKLLNALKYCCYELPYSVLLYKKHPLHILTAEESISRIIQDKMSIARLGDGELDIILGSSGIAFQKSSNELRNSLLEVLQSSSSKLMVCLPSCLTSHDVTSLRPVSERYWRRYAILHLKNIHQLLPPKTCFGDTHLTRPYIIWKHPAKHADSIYPMLKKAWDNRDILIVEGTMTRLGVGNDLFDNATNIRRILAPPKNAFSKRNMLLDSILKYHKENELVLLALGPTATILAAALSKCNIQALDIGHVDIEYCWYKMGSKEKVAIPGKYTNEVEQGRIQFSPTDDSTYNSQIITSIL